MTTYASGSVRVPGLSGNDTDFVSMIKQLKNIESRQVNQLIRWKKDWQTRLNAFKELRGELMNLQSTLRELGSISKFMAKATVSSDEKVATAVADGDAMNVSYNIQVKQKATNTTWTTDTGLYDKKDVISENGGKFTYTYKGKTRTVNVPKKTTIEGFVKLINNDSKNPGVKAQLIQSADGIAFQLRGMDTGKSSTLHISNTDGLTGLDLSLTNIKYEETENSFSLINKDENGVNHGFTAKTHNLNPSSSTPGDPAPENKTFVYTVDGTRRTIEITPDMTIEQLVQKINDTTPGLASLDEVGGEFFFKLEKPDTTYTVKADPDHTPPGPLGQILGDTGLGLPPKDFGADSDKLLNTGDPAVDMKLKMISSDGTEKEYTVTVTDESTYRTLANDLQKQVGDTAKVRIVKSNNDPSKFNIVIEPQPKTHRVTVEDGTCEELSYVPPSSEGWDVNHAVNAMVRINNYPSDPDKWMEVASNTLKSGEVMPGVTFYLHSAGEDSSGETKSADISVSTDTAKIEENIIKFVDAVNSFRSKLMELTKYDESKEVMDPDYAESQFEMQKGGVLQGNYGIQTVASRLKNSIASSAIGFNPRILGTDGSVLSGDLFTTLSQIGITTNAKEGEANYGLLEINWIDNNKGSKSLGQALAEDPEAVARLFAIDNLGESNSDDFHYNSHLPGITKPGSYDVRYEVDAAGEVIEDSVYINNQKAKYNTETNTITAVEDGPAKGIVIDVANVTPGAKVSGTVSIKSGKIGELLGMLDGTEGILGSKGTFKNLENNYQGIIDNIDKKIKKEDDRIQKWENTMVLKFARLESVLANYSGIQKTLESQLAQLGGNKK